MLGRELHNAAWQPHVRQTDFARVDGGWQRCCRARLTLPQDDLSIAGENNRVEPELCVTITRVDGLALLDATVREATDSAPVRVRVVIFSFANDFSVSTRIRAQDQAVRLQQKWRRRLLRTNTAKLRAFYPTARLGIEHRQ